MPIITTLKRNPVIQLKPESPLAENLNPEPSIPTEKKKNKIGTFIKRIFSISTGSRIFQNFVIKRKKIKMLIDSGSNVSFLRKKEWKRIGKPKLTDVDNSFITLSGRILDVKGMYMANVFFEGQEYQLPVFVANRIRNNIAGHPWLTVMDKVNCNRLIFPEKFEEIQQRKLEKQTSSEFLTMKFDINGFAIAGIVN
jgi:hypothetical protein